MAGVGIEATYDDGTLYASFICRLEVILGWDPPLYEAAIEIAIRARAFGIEAGLGVLLELEGPPTHGRAVVELGPFRPELRFGEWGVPPAFLSPLQFLADHVLNAAGDAVKGALAVTAGMIPPVGPPDPDDVRVGPDFVIETETGLPSTGWQVRYAGVEIAGMAQAGPRLDWVPCGTAGTGATSVHRVNITPVAAGGPTAAQVGAQGRLEVRPVVKGVPDAVWQAPPASATAQPGGAPKQAGARLVNAVVGVRVAGQSVTWPAVPVKVALGVIDPTGPDVIVRRAAGAPPGASVTESRPAGPAPAAATMPVARLAGRMRVGPRRRTAGDDGARPGGRRRRAAAHRRRPRLGDARGSSDRGRRRRHAPPRSGARIHRRWRGRGRDPRAAPAPPPAAKACCSRPASSTRGRCRATPRAPSRSPAVAGRA